MNERATDTDNQAGTAAGRAQAGGAPAAAGGLDLSLGHIGTSEEKRPWTAVCDACQWCLAEADYLAAEKAAGPTTDPRCPRPGCGRMLWSFHQL